MVEVLKKIAIIKSDGFMKYYLGYFQEICEKNGVVTDIFDDINDFHKNEFNKYDYVFGATNVPNGVGIYHSHSILERMNRAPFVLYKLIFYLGHLKKINESKKTYKNIKKLVVVSNNMQHDFCTNYNLSKDKVIVAHAGFVPEQDNKTIQLLKHNPFIVSISANGFVTKGGYNLLRALRKIRKMYPDIKIKANVIYPRYRSNLSLKFYIKLFKLNNLVEFFDYQSDMKKFYSKSNCHICASNFEPFGRVVTEAMNNKVPVIVGSNVGAADIIKDGVNGFIYQYDKNCDINLAKKIKEVYDKYNELNELVERAFEDSKKLTWENFARELFNGLYGEKLQ